MTTLSPDRPDTGARLSELILSLPADEVESVRFSLEGNHLVVEGRVASYSAKRKMENAAIDAGFQVQNGLRVTPGIASFATPQLKQSAQLRRRGAV